MKKVILGLMLGLCFMATSANAVELNEVYKFLGNYRTIASAGVRIYYPATAEESIARITTGLVKVREHFNEIFPKQKAYQATILLTDHDDRISSSSDPQLDLITLGMFEEMGALSTRAYSLEKRFALRLSNILLLRELGSARNALKRKLAIFAVPQWFLEGLTLRNAFSLDSIHFSRLLDMARHNRLYSLSKLDSIVNQPTLIKEEMKFQAHSMLEFWESRSGKKVGNLVMKNILKDPTGFRKLFKKFYGKSLPEAYTEYKNWVCEKCQTVKEELIEKEIIVHNKDIGGGFFRSFHQINAEERVWVSSRRYSTETYDLYYQKGNSRRRILLKNVHPALFVEENDREIYIGKYWVNSKRQRRLALWAVKFNGRARKLVDEAGSFKPLGKMFGRVFFTSIKSGITRILSVDPEYPDSVREEYTFNPTLRPLDIALGKRCRKAYFVVQRDKNTYNLCLVSIKKDDKKGLPSKLFASSQEIRNLTFHDDNLWFAAEGDLYTSQIYSLNEDEKPTLEKYSELPGGVWDFAIEKDEISVSTLDQGEFWNTRLPKKMLDKPIFIDEPEEVSFPKLLKLRSYKYQNDLKTKYWLPTISEDEEGGVFGIYSYRADRLDRYNIIVAPEYGFKSKNWGYLASVMHRFGLLKVNASIKDKVTEKSYLGNDYFERSRAKILDFSYPLTLSTSLSVGADLTKRSIAKIPQNNNPYPTVGRDHSYYMSLRHKAIRTEPYWEVFPRKGRNVQASYKRGADFLDGDLIYDSTSLKWEEYLPVTDNWVFTTRLYLAKDNKENNVRRPDDLSLGGSDFMRGYKSSFRAGNSARAVGFHLGHPLRFKFPRFMSWLKNEFLVGEVFWEAGDVKTNRDFEYVFDRGVELRMQALLLRRIPLLLRFGMAWPNNGEDSRSYFSVDFTGLKDLIQ